MSERGEGSEATLWADVDASQALQRYRALVDIVDAGIFQLDSDGRFVSVNDVLVEITGYTREDLVGEPVSVVLDDADHRRIDREISDRLETGERRTETFDVPVQTADGGRIRCALRLRLLVTNDEFRGTIGIVRDVGDRSTAEEATERQVSKRGRREPGRGRRPSERERKGTERNRRERELELFRILLDHSTDSVLVIDPDTGHYLDVNETACRRRGYAREELLNLSVPDVEVGLPDQTAWQSFVEDLRASGEIAFDGRHRRKDGTTYPVEVNASYADLDREYVLAISRDVTERKERERERERKERERELQRYERILETIDDGVYVLDGDSRFRTMNEAFADMLGRDREELLGAHASAVFHEENVERAERFQREMIEGETDIGELEEHIKAADGEVPVVTRFALFETDDEVGRVGVVRDVTERNERERELERNKEQLETLFDVLPVGVIVAEADGELVAANDTAHEIWGGDVFDATSIEEYERYPVRRADSDECVDPEEMTLARVLRGEEVREPDIYEIETVDGERRIVELEGMPIRDESGEVIRGVVTISDVTERRETQRRLAESERRYRTLVENFPNGAVGLFDEDLRYTAAGGEVLEDVDTSAAEIVGKTIWERYPPDLATQLEPKFRAALEGETNSFEIEVHDHHWLAYTLPVEDDDGDTFAGMMMVQDITEQVERERRLEEVVDKLEASNERLEQFAYAVSHDLQEPLRMVSSYVRLLEQRYADELDDDAEEFIEYAVDGAERMQEMIDGLLEYSRVETRGDPFEPVDLDHVIDDVITDLQFRIEETGAEITTDSLPVVDGDPGQLRQMFQNLLKNALKYSGDEPPRVYVSAERREAGSVRESQRDSRSPSEVQRTSEDASDRSGTAAENGGSEWQISVSDEGIGIDPDDQDRIFEVFQRLHSHDEHTGTGIGLALSERIVERHGGEIWVDSEPGEETTSTFTLPDASGDGG